MFKKIYIFSFLINILAINYLICSDNKKNKFNILSILKGKEEKELNEKKKEIKKRLNDKFMEETKHKKQHLVSKFSFNQKKNINIDDLENSIKDIKIKRANSKEFSQKSEKIINLQACFEDNKEENKIEKDEIRLEINTKENENEKRINNLSLIIDDLVQIGVINENQEEINKTKLRLKAFLNLGLTLTALITSVVVASRQ